MKNIYAIYKICYCAFVVGDKPSYELIMNKIKILGSVVNIPYEASKFLKNP